MHNYSALIHRVFKENKPSGIQCAICDDGRLLEFYCQNDDDMRTGSVYVGELRELNEKLSGAYFSLGTLGEVFCPLKKRLFSAYKCGNLYPIQIKKEPYEDKLTEGSVYPELTNDFFVISSRKSTDFLRISKKISDENVKDLLKREIMPLFDTEKYSVVIRTASAQISSEERISAFNEIYKQFLTTQIELNCLRPGDCLYEAEEAWLLRAKTLSLDENGIVLIFDNREDKIRYANLGDKYTSRLYADNYHIFDFYRIAPQLSEALSEKLFMDDGGYLYIENTHAMHVIDVNSAKSFPGRSRRDALLKMNLKACDLVFDQLRLRNLSGIVIVDFISMEKPDDYETLLKFAKEKAKDDPLPITICGFTALGLLELSRERRELPLKDKYQPM